MPHRPPSDWTGKVYPKDHDTTLDHPGRIIPPGHSPLARSLNYSLSEWSQMYYKARFGRCTITGFIDFVTTLDNK